MKRDLMVFAHAVRAYCIQCAERYQLPSVLTLMKITSCAYCGVLTDCSIVPEKQLPEMPEPSEGDDDAEGTTG